MDFYRGPGDLPEMIPLFPLTGALLLPRAFLPLNIFEPRYLAMVDDALAGGRLIGMIQPRLPGSEGPDMALDQQPVLYDVGCAGRITAFSETEDRRMLITLTGIARFRVGSEVSTDRPYRMAEVSFSDFGDDFSHGTGEGSVDREHVLTTLRAYLDTNDMEADWESINQSSTEMLVNTLCMACPCSPEEKQALLEAPDLESRSETLVTITEMILAGGEGSDTALQ